ncbi:MAG: hypothetical protein DRJ38_00170 [Thermoprotei archaeon]|nr:MAG: hypothetical protein DRJ38_00170 [Thermoprotei archaeon]
MIEIKETKILNDPQKVAVGAAVFHVETTFVVPRADNQAEVEQRVKQQAVEQTKHKAVTLIAQELAKLPGEYVTVEVNVKKPVLLLPQKYPVTRLAKLLGGERHASSDTSVRRTG